MDSVAVSAASVWAMLTVAYDVYRKASQDSRLQLQSLYFEKELRIFEHNLAERVVYRHTRASSLDINQGLLDKFDRTGNVVQKRLRSELPQSDTKNVKRILTPFLPEPKANKGLNELTQLLQQLNEGFRDNTQPMDRETGRSSTFSEATSSIISSPPAERNPMSRAPPRASVSTNVSVAGQNETSSSTKPVQTLWQASADALTVMMKYAPPSENVDIIKTIRDRMHLWGTSLFGEGDVHLDALVSGTEDAEKKFREPLASHLIEIEMAQVQIIERWTSSGSKHGYADLRDALTSLKSTLVGSKMTKKLLEDFIYRTIEEKSQDGDSSRELDLDFLRDMVEILFDFLPAISILRTRHILRTPELNFPGGSVGYLNNQKSSTDKIADDLQTLEQLLKARESAAKSRDLQVAKLSSRAARERENFLKTRMANKRNSHIALDDPKIEQIQRTLSDRIRETNYKLSSQENVLLKKLKKGSRLAVEVEKEIAEEENYVKETLKKVGEVTVLILRARRATA